MNAVPVELEPLELPTVKIKAGLTIPIPTLPFVVNILPSVFELNVALRVFVTSRFEILEPEKLE